MTESTAARSATADPPIVLDLPTTPDPNYCTDLDATDQWRDWWGHE